MRVGEDLHLWARQVRRVGRFVDPEHDAVAAPLAICPWSVSSKFANWWVGDDVAAAGGACQGAPSRACQPFGIVDCRYPRQPEVVEPSKSSRQPAARSAVVRVFVGWVVGWAWRRGRRNAVGNRQAASTRGQPAHPCSLNGGFRT
jgi:hypothetical protein